MPPDLAANPKRLDRFQREMAAIGRLEHQHIVLATDAGQADGYFYIAMQYVDGFDLADSSSSSAMQQSGSRCRRTRNNELPGPGTKFDKM